MVLEMDQKQQDILDGAIQMFGRIGIRSVSMDDLAQELHMSKKTIYLYFKNKEELIEAMLNHHLELDLRNYEAICSKENTNAIDVLLLVSESVCKHINETSHAQVFELKKYYPEQFSAFWISKRDRISSQIKANIEQGIAQNLFRDDLDIELISNLYVRRLEDFSEMCDEMFKKYSFEQVFKTMFESHIRGISNTNGIAYFEKKKKELNY
jgi:TetR/AcrR family transcriptional regulator, cholesterol catabolism regulator